MNQPETISASPPEQITLDFRRLRAEGMKYIERYGSAWWTDYNVHDPGITLLELLCFAITELGYRTNLPVEDVLATENDNELNLQNQFFQSKEILPSRPLTELDIRKLLIDLPGVKNAWLFRAEETLFFDKNKSILTGAAPQHSNFSTYPLNGLYTIKIELDENPLADDCTGNNEVTPEEAALAEQQKKEILARVRETFHRHRNLCEDLHDITVVEEQKIRFCMDVQLSTTAHATDVYAQILYEIAAYLSPPIRQYTLVQMLNERKSDGSPYSMDEIFDGPLLKHGFMKEEAVLNAGLREQIYMSDILSKIMDIPGVVSVRNFMMNDCEDASPEKHEWVFAVTPGKKPALCYCKSAFNFYKDVIPVRAVKADAVKKWLARLQEEKAAAEEAHVHDYQFPAGTWADIETYTPVSKQLPQVYGVGENGLPFPASAARKVKALQLKGFLLFFDQIMANYLSQLHGLKELLKVKNSTLSDPQIPTYFFQKITDDNDMAKLLMDYETMLQPGGWMDQLMNEKENALDRKSRLLDHLLARFAENFNEYILQLNTLEGNQSPETILSAKSRLLNEYPTISANRSGGYDWFNTTDEAGAPLKVWDTANVSGMEHRLARLLGIANHHRRKLSSEVNDGSDEGMFVIEHILLRPDLTFLREKNELSEPSHFIPVCEGDDCEDCGDDPYSFRITVILPAESVRFRDFDFRTYIENTIRLETPAHIYPRICWWKRADLKALEEVYEKWLLAKQGGKMNTAAGIKLNKELITLINERKSVYPPGIISDCDHPVENPVILDRTNLGNLKT